jgi:hypothetical protein
MTEENKSVLAEEERIVLLNLDLFLNSVVKCVNTAPVERRITLDITLCVQGSLVSGLLIGEKAYFKGLSNDIKASGSFKKDFQEFLAQFLTSGTNSPDNQGEPDKLKDIEFIHLKNAQFYSGNSFTPPQKKVYWRGRLSCIDGFWLGDFSSSGRLAFGSLPTSTSS